MKITFLSANKICAFLISIGLIYGHELPICDISHQLTQQVTSRALSAWALLDLAEQEHIVDYALFFDTLCQTTLALCKEVQILKESGYLLGDQQTHCMGTLLGMLHMRFQGLSDIPEYHIKHVHAIDTILHYSKYFLIENLDINAGIEAAHSNL